jgi:thiol-disulfide isomerase/thioredoxin
MKTLLALAFLVSISTNYQSRGEALDPFELKRFGTGEAVKLGEFAGRIIVLDFFASWCQPCGKSAPVVESQIQQYFASRGGNRHGIPVQVISVNVDTDDGAQTTAFVQKHKQSLVVNDAGGALFQKLGGRGLPYFVILDGTQRSGPQPQFEIVYRKLGFEGAPALQKVIENIGGSRP